MPFDNETQTKSLLRLEKEGFFWSGESVCRKFNKLLVSMSSAAS